MKPARLRRRETVASLDPLRGALARVLEVQRPDGAIPWFEDGPWDPWNHVESAMALSVMGEHGAAAAAYDYLRRSQRSDGAWMGEYGSELPFADRLHMAREKAPEFLDSNFIAYVAVGAWHRFQITGDGALARRDFEMVAAALDFVLGLQTEHGDVSWAQEAVGTSVDDALVAGNCSIAKSLECGAALGGTIGADVSRFIDGRLRLAAALRSRPDRFDRSGKNARFAMDWYYPALSGVFTPAECAARLQDGAARFVAPDVGCRCVEDEPWVTAAETAELSLAWCAAGDLGQAERFFNLARAVADDSGALWMGWQMEERIFWPRERPSWTQAAAILAADAVYEVTPAARVLTAPALKSAQDA